MLGCPASSSPPSFIPDDANENTANTPFVLKKDPILDTCCPKGADFNQRRRRAPEFVAAKMNFIEGFGNADSAEFCAGFSILLLNLR